MNEPRVRTSLQRFHTHRRDPEQVRREGWIEQGIFAVSIDDERLDELDVQMIKSLAKRLYER